MDIDALRCFVQVAELASFTRAAERLGLPKPRVSAKVQALEAELGTRLLHRTTRRVHPTVDGELLLERCPALLAEVDEVQALFQREPSALRGRLRLDLPHAIACRQVLPRLPEFLARHPALEVSLSTSDRRVDPVAEGIDCVLRIGSLADSGLVARRIGLLPQINCASAAYLARHGVPRSLDDLAPLHIVRYGAPPGPVHSAFEYVDAQGRLQLRPMQGLVTVDSTEAYQAACLAGLGLIRRRASATPPCSSGETSWKCCRSTGRRRCRSRWCTRIAATCRDAFRR